MTTLGRILILDDESRWREILSEILLRAGYEVHTASSVKEAQALLRESLFHLLLLDIRLDGMIASNTGGMDLLQWLTEEGQIGGLEIIMNTAYGAREQMRKAFQEFQVFDFLAKEDFDNLDF